MDNLVDKTYKKTPQKNSQGTISVDWFMITLLVLGLTLTLCVTTYGIVFQKETTLRRCLDHTKEVLACRF